MSLKFKKNRSVDVVYMVVPLLYTGILHRTNKNKELVLIDNLGKHWIAAYRNHSVDLDKKSSAIGRTFLVKSGTQNGKRGFYYKDKFYYFTRYGWVW
jgi:hypothetical protein